MKDKNINHKNIVNIFLKLLKSKERVVFEEVSFGCICLKLWVQTVGPKFSGKDWIQNRFALGAYMSTFL